MKALGFEVKKADILKIFQEYDQEESGKINFDDYFECGKIQLNENYHFKFYKHYKC